MRQNNSKCKITRIHINKSSFLDFSPSQINVLTFYDELTFSKFERVVMINHSALFCKSITSHPILIKSTTYILHLTTRQIWGIWQLRPAFSPETPNLGQNRWCFVPCDLEIWWMTLENNRASLLCCFKLCATFHSHRWIQTGVTVQKLPIWVKLDDF